MYNYTSRSKIPEAMVTSKRMYEFKIFIRQEGESINHICFALYKPRILEYNSVQARYITQQLTQYGTVTDMLWFWAQAHKSLYNGMLVGFIRPTFMATWKETAKTLRNTHYQNTRFVRINKILPLRR